MTHPSDTQPAIGSREDLARPGALRAALAELAALAAAGGEVPIDRLRALASPEGLDVLFRVALGRSLRRGPAGVSELGSPARWLALAAAAAGAGALPVATGAALRSSLDLLAEELTASGAWGAQVPLWWSPLPARGDLEGLWLELGGEPRAGRPVGVPPVAQSRAAFGSGPEAGARWLAWGGALPPKLLARVAAELAAAAGEDGLSLRGAGVGRLDRRSSQRSDEVRYLTGLEPELIAGAPALAGLIQHLLGRAEEPLRRTLPGLELHAPQTVMLARYPAPASGFAAHLDNPGGEDDNGRALSLVVYLNPPQRPCRGGGLALWPAGAAGGDPPVVVLPPAGGSAVLFDARTVVHAVEPLEPGPDRWTLVLWWSERPRRPPRPLVPVPAPTAAEVLLPIDDPPVVPGAVLFRRVDREGKGRVEVHRPAPGRRPRAGVVATVRGGAGELGAWCRHHLDLGVDHLVLVLDEGAEPGEAEGLEALRRELGRERFTLWSDPEARRRREGLPSFEGRDVLAAAAGYGPATWAVAARQGLNATAVLHAAAAREASDLGAAALDWLVHLDGDELLHLEGSGRGGAALGEHFAAAEAAGWRALRYLNHELLLPWHPGAPARFKRNPELAAARLGGVGWARLARHLGMEQGDRRPYFRAYWNGKSAVAVAAGARADGVHAWCVPGVSAAPTLAGPSVLHFHLPTAEAFRQKYLLVASAPDGLDDAARPFPPSDLERAACSLVREHRESGAGAAGLAARLDALYAERTAFTAEEVELLAEADLLFTPRLPHLPLPEAALPAGRD
jgi:hypothetical protein